MVAPGSFLTLSASQVARRKRRTFSALVGALLAVTLVAAGTVSVDSSARLVVERLLDDVEVDMVARTSGTSDHAGAASAIAGTDRVRAVEPVSAYQLMVEAGHPGDRNLSFKVRLSGVLPSFGEHAGRFGFGGKFELRPGGVVIGRELSRGTGVGAGGTLELRQSYLVRVNSSTGEKEYAVATANLTVSSVISHSRLEPSIQAPGAEAGTRFVREQAAFVDLGELGALASRLRGGEAGYRDTDQLFNRTFHYCIWLDRSSVVNPFDLEGSRQAVMLVEQRIMVRGGGWGVEVIENGLTPVVQETYKSVDEARMRYLAFSLPVMALGMYLALVGVELGMAGRRQEVSLLRARGAGRRHLMASFLAEHLMLGVLAGLGGLVLGAAVTFALLAWFIPGGVSGGPGLYITPGSAGMAVALGVVLMLLAMYRPARRASQLEITEGLKYYSTEESTEKYHARWAVLMTGVALFFYLVLILFDPRQWYEKGTSASPLFVALTITKAIGTVLSFLWPVLLIFGVTSLLTRASYRPYAAVSRLAKPLTRELWPVVHHNLVRNPKRASRVCIIIALAMTFGLFVTLWTATEEDRQERLAGALVGADVRAQFIPARPADGDALRVELASLPGVRGIAAAYQVDRVSLLRSSIDLFLLETADYARVVPVEGSYFSQGGMADLRDLPGGKRLIINEALRDQTSARVGDVVTLTLSLSNRSPVSITCRVTSVVRMLPGLVEGDGDTLRWQVPAAYMDRGNLELDSLFVSRVTFFMDASTPASTEREVIERYGSGGSLRAVRTREGYVAELREGPLMAEHNFLLLESAFTVLIVTSGLALIMTAAVLERKQETAGWLARGATRRQIASLFFSEALVLVVLAAAVGVATGLLTAWVSLGIFSTGSSSPVARRFVFSQDGLILTAGTVAALLAISAAVAWKAARTDPAAALRLRGG